MWDELSDSDVEAMEAACGALGLSVVRLKSQAGDRVTFLRRPDLGRRLDEGSVEALRAVEGECDVVIVVGDGLSALAGRRHAMGVIQALTPLLRAAGLRVGPVAVVRQARVAVEDEVGEILGARMAVMLIGERPGLGAAESLGAYLVYGPRVGNTDERRNCVSSIRDGGLSVKAGAEAIGYLLVEAFRRKLSGVGLKDERGEGFLAADGRG